MPPSCLRLRVCTWRMCADRPAQVDALRVRGSISASEPRTGISYWALMPHHIEVFVPLLEALRAS